MSTNCSNASTITPGPEELSVEVLTATAPPKEPANATLEAVYATLSPEVLMAPEVWINAPEEDKTLEQDDGEKAPMHDAIVTNVYGAMDAELAADVKNMRNQAERNISQEVYSLRRQVCKRDPCEIF
jgi:hypothetical protein